MKKEAVRWVNDLLFRNNFNNREGTDFEELERRFVKEFYLQYKNALVFNTSYTDWLLIGLRKVFKNQEFSNSLVTSYLHSNNLNSFSTSFIERDERENSFLNSFIERERFFKLLQFLSFIRTCEGSKFFVEDQVYYSFTFPLDKFLMFTGVGEKYQHGKALKFFRSLQDLKPLVQKFSDYHFRSSVIFPYLNLERETGKAQLVKIAVGEELYLYHYPFFLPECFLTSQSKYDLEIKFEFIESFSQIGLEKKLYIEDFFKKFRIPNKKRREIKERIIGLFEELKNKKLIKEEFQIITKSDSLLKVTQLTPGLLSKNRCICFYETLETLNFKTSLTLG